MQDEHENRIIHFLASIHTMPAAAQGNLRKQAGENLRRIRDLYFPNKLSAMVAKLQEGDFRKNLNPTDLERQVRRWISDGLPLGNVEGLARALDVSPAEFIPVEILSTGISPTDEHPTDSSLAVGGKAECLPLKKDHPISSAETVSIDVGGAKCKKEFVIGGIITLFMAAMLIGFLGAGMARKRSIEILWPNIVASHSEFVSGQLNDFPADELKDLTITLFVKPMDGDNKYWLDIPPFPGIITEKGIWYQKCRFGDEDYRTMKRVPPLRFNLYAVLFKKDTELPVNSRQNYIEAASEARFLETLKPLAESISKPFSITRVKPAEPDIPIVVAMAPPVRITWGEQVPMYLEIYHGGQIIKNGFFQPGEQHDLQPSPILYEIKMSRKKGYHRSNLWILVQDHNT